MPATAREREIQLPSPEYYIAVHDPLTRLQEYIGPMASLEDAKVTRLFYPQGEVMEAADVDRASFRAQVVRIRSRLDDSNRLNLGKINNPRLRRVVDAIVRGGLP